MMIVWITTSAARAGTVTFEPLTDSVVQPGETVEFELSISRDGGAAFNLANIVIESIDFSIDSFEYAQSWLDANAYPLSPPTHWEIPGYYSWFGGGFLAVPVKGDAVVGTIVISISDDFSLGDYSIIVDSERDFLSSIGLDSDIEPLFGFATISVIPEPAAVLLLGIGGLAVISRKKLRSSH